MALFNESLEGRFSRLIGALHSMKGPNPAPQVTPEIAHIISISDDFDRKAHHYLEGTTRYASGRFNLSAAVGFFSTFDFSLAASSGVIVVVEKLILVSQAALVQFDLRTNGPVVAAGTTGNGIPLDTREGGKKSALLITANNTSVGAITGQQLASGDVPASSADTEVLEASGFVIHPGGRLTCFDQTANQAFQLRSLIWRERAANPAELRIS